MLAARSISTNIRSAASQRGQRHLSLCNYLATRVGRPADAAPTMHDEAGTESRNTPASLLPTWCRVCGDNLDSQWNPIRKVRRRFAVIEAIAIRVWVARLAVICFIVSSGAVADEPARRGGTLNMVAPYGASVSSLDPHSTARTQDEVISQALHRTLYRWNSTTNRPELELAESVEVSDDGLTYTYNLLTNAYFHNGRQMTADDVIWSYTRVMDSKRGYPVAGNVRVIAGAVDYESGNANQISGLEKVDDFTLRITISDRVDPAYYLFDGTTSILPREEVENEAAFQQHPVGAWAIQVCRVRDRLAPGRRAIRSLLQARPPLRRSRGVLHHG